MFIADFNMARWLTFYSIYSLISVVSALLHYRVHALLSQVQTHHLPLLKSLMSDCDIHKVDFMNHDDTLPLMKIVVIALKISIGTT